MNDTIETHLVTLYCLVDEFCQLFVPFFAQQLLKNKVKKRNRSTQMSMSEMLTICMHFHQSTHRTFKHYYHRYVQDSLKPFFPKLISYERFVQLMPTLIVPLFVFLKTLMGEKTGLYFIDSMLMRVCHIKRERQHKVFRGLAKKSKSSIGWFFGFKLHLVINDKGEMMAVKLTPGNVDDRRPAKDLMKTLVGKLIGDKGYISKKLFSDLWKQGVQLITRIKKNMKGGLMPLVDKLLLRKRAVIESVNDQLKNVMQIEPTRHRSIWNFTVNTLSALIAYSLQPKKPSIRNNMSKLFTEN